MDDHKTVVAKIAADIRRFYERQQPFRIYHGSSNSTRTLDFQRDRMVDTSQLNRVIKVDAAHKIVLVEPNVPMDQLVEATLPFGLVPPVIMEFPGITVGGGFSGTSGESSSFKYGFFDKTVNWIETVLANGEVTTASTADKPDLFEGTAGSFGTLSVVTLLEVKLIDAAAYVELCYTPVSSIPDAIKTLERETEDTTNDYVDGILFSRTSGVIISGTLTDTPSSNSRVQRFARARDPLFYCHAQTRTQSIIEAVPIVDYLFRYDRGAFWMAKYAFDYFHVPFTRFFQFLLNPVLHTRTMYHALHESGFAQQYIVQDLALPQSTVEEFINYVDTEFGFYPLWLCPLQKNQGTISLHPDASMPSTRKGMLINVGVWGPGSTDPKTFIAQNRQLERKLRDLSGLKWLYAHAYYTESEFWSIYDKTWYDALRAKYHATGLPSVFDKVKVDVERHYRQRQNLIWRIWPMAGLYGVVKMLLGSDYVVANEHRVSRVLMMIALGLWMVWMVASR